jgi:cytochrome b561
MNVRALRRYTPIAISLHWLLAFAMLDMVALGFHMHDLHLLPLRLRLFNWHKTGVHPMTSEEVMLGIAVEAMQR